MATNEETAMPKLILAESNETTNNAPQSINEIARLGAQAIDFYCSTKREEVGRRPTALDGPCSPMLMEFSPVFYPQILLRSLNSNEVNMGLPKLTGHSI